MLTGLLPTRKGIDDAVLFTGTTDDLVVVAHEVIQVFLLLGCVDALSENIVQLSWLVTIVKGVPTR